MSEMEDNDRREFLKVCGKFAAVTPPAMTVLLSTSLTSGAIASSSGRVVHSDGNQNDQGQNNNSQ